MRDINCFTHSTWARTENKFEDPPMFQRVHMFALCFPLSPVRDTIFCGLSGLALGYSITTQFISSSGNDKQKQIDQGLPRRILLKYPRTW